MIGIQIYNSKQHHLMTHKGAIKVAAINAGNAQISGTRLSG